MPVNRERLSLIRTPNSALQGIAVLLCLTHLITSNRQIMTTLNSLQQPSSYVPALLADNVSQSSERARTIPTTPITALPDGRQALKAALGDRRNLQTLAQVLTATVAKLPENADAQAVASALQQTHMPINPVSTFMHSRTLKPATVSLEAFIKDQGIWMPEGVADLKALAHALAEQALTHPLGNFAGALSWSLPLSVNDQREVFNAVACNSAQLAGLPLQNARWGALDYLAEAQSLSTAELSDPVKALEKLLDSPRAQALGEAIQLKVRGIATDKSVNDYVLAAIHLGLDPQSIDSATRNSVAGFDLAANAHFGKSPAEVISALAEHLSSTGKTARHTAELGARLLLARVAPQFLITDIPAGVSIASQAWANLCLAVASIESQTPGKTARMSFSEVMQAAEALPTVSDAAQKAIVIDWAVANQVVDKRLDDAYPSDEIQTALEAFNQQQTDLKAASDRLETPMPNRKAMALALLKKKFGDGVDFEQKNLRINYGTEIKGLRFSNPYSMLDITMQGLKLGDSWQVHGATTLDLPKFVAFTRSSEFNIPAAFDKAFADVIHNYKSIKKDLVMNAITHLPLEDRTQLSYGKLRFFKENSYKTSPIPFVGDRLFHSSPTILVQTEHEGKKQSYAFDTVKGTIQKVLNHPANRQPDYISNEVTKVEEFFPDANAHALKEFRTIYRRPNLFQNPRIQDVADTVVKGLEIDSAAVRRQAEGRTPAEQRRDTVTSIGELLLDLIPLRSAIVNLSTGNYKDAVTDLAFDVFGLLTAGVGTAAKLAKGASKTTSTVGKVLRATRVIGANTLSALNPLSGLGDLTVGAGKLTLAGVEKASEGIQRVRGAFTGSDLIKAGSEFDAAAIGVFQQGGRHLEVGAVQHDGKWYAIDQATLQPYGPPLEGFSTQDTLMPKALNPGGTRHHPYHQGTSSPSTLEPLPDGNYVESTKGKLKWSHFAYEDTKKQTVQKFQDEMNGYYEAVTAGTKSTPPRPTLPDYPGTVPAEKLITDALKSAPGIVFGESHSEMASFRLLFDKAEQLKQEGVKKVYLEGVIDFPGHGAIDDGLGLLGNSQLPRTNPTYAELVARLKENGIDVVPLDHYYLTRHKDQKIQRATTGNGSERRLKEFNYYASKVIQSDAGTDKWVALVGRSHMNTSEGILGLAEQTGATGVAIFNLIKPGVAPFGLKFKTNLADPNKPILPGQIPGDLHILA